MRLIHETTTHRLYRSGSISTLTCDNHTPTVHIPFQASSPEDAKEFFEEQIRNFWKQVNSKFPADFDFFFLVPNNPIATLVCNITLRKHNCTIQTLVTVNSWPTVNPECITTEAWLLFYITFHSMIDHLLSRIESNIEEYCEGT